MVQITKLIEACPRLYHVAAEGSWPSVERHGLLSTEAIVELFDVPEPRRTAILECRRAGPEALEHPVHGAAQIRDQIPMNEAKLAKCLPEGFSPASWFRLLNTFVFMWPTLAAAQNMMSAQEYRTQPKTLLVLDADRLFMKHHADVRLTRINTGATLYDPAPRGPDTFQRIGDFAGKAPKEICVRRSIADVRSFVLEVHNIDGDGQSKRVR